jgi:glucuronokinase
MIECHAYARAGLVGNPSDGYHGKTISFIVKNFAARVTLEPSEQIEIVPNQRDHSAFHNLQHLRDDVGLFGYYGGVRLLKAACKVFAEHAEKSHLTLDASNFRLSYESNIPNHVGMAGSSAIITACMRTLMQHFKIAIAPETLAGLVLAVEKNELGIPAGLQDRVIQSYEGLVFMDFDRTIMDRQGCGYYEQLDPALLPPIYVAYSTDLSEGTEVFHNDLRARYERGDQRVHAAIQRWASLAEQVKFMLLQNRHKGIGELLNENFDLRRSICPLHPGHIRMVETARSCGASAKFTGSGGAIVGTYENQAMFDNLTAALAPLNVAVIKPQIV